MPIAEDEGVVGNGIVDGIPMKTPNNKSGIDGTPLLKSHSNTPLLKSSAAISALMGYNDDEEEDEDLDGAPCE